MLSDGRFANLPRSARRPFDRRSRSVYTPTVLARAEEVTPWAPQPGETPEEYLRFQCYLNSDPRPNVSRLPVALARGWVSRASEYDRYVSGQEVVSQSAPHRRRRALALTAVLRELALGEAQKHYLASVQSSAPTTTLAELARVAKDILKVETELLTGTEQSAENVDLSRLSDDEMVLFETLLRKAQNE